MNSAAIGAEFVVSAAISLFASSIFVVRLERVGARFHLSEAVLGLLAALGADSPEITSSVTALVHHQRGVAVGVVLGSNIFNLAALLGLGALSAGRIALHRRVVVLAGLPALIVVAMTMGLEHGAVGAWPAAIVLLAILIPYVAMLESPDRVFRLLHLSRTSSERIRRAITEDESDLATVIAPEEGTPKDSYVALMMLVIVVVASVVMERIGSTIGQRGHLSALIVGGVILAAVTSLPNAVAAIYLARHGRGAAALSTAMHSNTINVTVGLVVPALIIGLGPSTSAGSLLALWSLGFTIAILIVAYWRRGIGRISGAAIVVAYLGCLWTMTHP